MQKISYSAVSLFLHKIEQKKDTHLLQFEGYNIWPIVRTLIYHQTLEEYPSNFVPKGFRIDTKDSYIAVGTEEKEKPFTDTEVLFFPANVSLVKFESVYIDRVLDPTLFIAQKLKKCEKIHISPIDKDLYLPGENMSFTVDSTAVYLFPESLKKNIIEIVKDFPIDIATLLHALQYRLASFLQGMHCAQNMVRCSPKLKYIFMTCYTDPFRTGMIAGFKKNNIITLDIQHCAHGVNPEYRNWKNIPREGYSMLPDYFWLWGEKDLEFLLDKNQPNPNHKGIVAGLTWVDFYKTILRKTSTIKQNKKQVIFILGAPSAEAPEYLPLMAFDFLKSPISDKYDIVFRPHPHEFGYQPAITAVEKLIRQFPNKSLRISYAREEMLSDLFAESAHAVIGESTSALEASFFEISILIWGTFGHARYKDQIEAKEFPWVAHDDTNAFINWLEAPKIKSDQEKDLVSSMELCEEKLIELFDIHK